MENNELKRGQLRIEIINYLRKNPNAGDSLKGVMSWWISSAHKNANAAKIEQVLEQLIIEGLVKKVSLIDGTFLYKQGGKDTQKSANRVGK